MVFGLYTGVYKAAEGGGEVGWLAGQLSQWRGGTGAEGHSFTTSHSPSQGNRGSPVLWEGQELRDIASGLLTVPLKVTEGLQPYGRDRS